VDLTATTGGAPSPVFLTAEWRDLVMVNFSVDPVLLEPYVPAGTTLDSWGGMTPISMVGFRFLDARVLGWSLPRHRDFEEINLRFYVRREHPDGPRRGVVFIKEIVPRRAIATIARWIYNEPYVRLPMRHRVTEAENGRREASYGWRRAGAWGEVGVITTGRPALPTPLSHEEFITEHYWGYTRQRDGSTLEYRVEHPPWDVWQGIDARVTGDLAALYGADLGAALRESPTSACLARGSRIVVRRGRRL